MGYRKTGLQANPSNHGWYTCVRCGKKFRAGDIEIDHILPQHYGGGNGPDNLQCLCRHCNASKGASLSDTAQDYVRHNARRAKDYLNDLF